MNPMPRAKLVRSAVAAMFVLVSAPCWAANPLDLIGAEHNRYLACILEQPEPRSLETIAVGCGYDAQTPEEFAEAFGPLMPTRFDQSIGEQIQPHRDYFSAQEYEYIAAIESLMVVRESSITSLNAAYAELARMDAQLADLESQAQVELDMRTAGAQAVLASLSTARHSIRFWAEYYFREIGIGSAKKFPSLKQIANALLKVAAVAGTDLVVAGVGAAAATVVPIITPGVPVAAAAASAEMSKAVNGKP